jgi:hypothetical protein
VTVNVQTPTVAGGFVYGEGGAYRAKGIFDSFPHLKLPHLNDPRKGGVSRSAGGP